MLQLQIYVMFIVLHSIWHLPLNCICHKIDCGIKIDPKIECNALYIRKKEEISIQLYTFEHGLMKAKHIKTVFEWECFKFIASVFKLICKRLLWVVWWEKKSVLTRENKVLSVSFWKIHGVLKKYMILFSFVFRV